jgi:hypothetical protein
MFDRLNGIEIFTPLTETADNLERKEEKCRKKAI